MFKFLAVSFNVQKLHANYYTLFKFYFLSLYCVNTFFYIIQYYIICLLKDKSVSEHTRVGTVVLFQQDPLLKRIHHRLAIGRSVKKNLNYIKINKMPLKIEIKKNCIKRRSERIYIYIYYTVLFINANVPLDPENLGSYRGA